MGAAGDNFTGATSGGMEVGTDHILTTGSSIPHSMKVSFVCGNDKLYYVRVDDSGKILKKKT
ncbi:MAG: hypothetical protein K6G81_04860 [Lachnospiraceae bacterium]|nr:hypothetical protein [Lachnospiraceae bacterium]